MLNYIILNQPASDGSGLMNIGMIILLVVIFYFFMIRPQQKKQKEIRKFRESTQVGDKVVSAGGIYGKVRRVKETAFVVEVAPDVLITIDKNSIYPSATDAQTDAESDKTQK